MIVGKKVTEENEPVVYSTPFDTIIDILDLRVPQAENIISLLANCPNMENGEPSSKRLFTMESYDSPYYGFSRLALRADFRSWLRETGCIQGDYGLKITVDFAAETTKENQTTYPVIRKELYLNIDDMIGNPYQFDTFFSQEKVFDISSYGGISAIYIDFYQTPGSFLISKKDENDNYEYLKYKDDFDGFLFNNLFIQNVQIAVGYDLGAYDSDFVQLYSFDQPNFSSSENEKNIKLKWIHLDGEKQIVMSPEITGYDYEIRWYRYLMGEQASDAYVTGGWVNMSDPLNEGVLIAGDNQTYKKIYQTILKPAAAKQSQEEIKAIVLFGQAPEYERHTFPEDDEEALEEFNKNAARYFVIENDNYVNCKDKKYDADINKDENTGYYILGPDTRKIYRTKPIVFSNDKDIVVNGVIDALSALSLTCFDYNKGKLIETYGNYLIYNQGNQLIDYAESSIIRGVRCNFDLIDTENDDTNSLLTDTKISWIYPVKNTMIAPYSLPYASDSILVENLTFDLKTADETTKQEDIYYKKITYTEDYDWTDKVTVYGAPYFLYKIMSTFSPRRMNNFIQCIVEKDEVSYHTVQELTFGQAGSAGTEYTFILEPVEDLNVLTAEKENTLNIKALLYDSSGKQLDINGKTIQWKFLDPSDTSKTKNTIGNLELSITTSSSVENTITGKPNINDLCIVQAILTDWEDYQLTAFLPVPIRSDEKYLALSGPTSIVHLTDGHPQYYDAPYEIYSEEEVSGVVWTDCYSGDVNSFQEVENTINENDYLLNKTKYYFKTDSNTYINCANEPWSREYYKRTDTVTSEALPSLTQNEYNRNPAAYHFKNALGEMQQCHEYDPWNRVFYTLEISGKLKLVENLTEEEYNKNPLQYYYQNRDKEIIPCEAYDPFQKTFYTAKSGGESYTPVAELTQEEYYENPTLYWYLGHDGETWIQCTANDLHASDMNFYYYTKNYDQYRTLTPQSSDDYSDYYENGYQYSKYREKSLIYIQNVAGEYVVCNEINEPYERIYHIKDIGTIHEEVSNLTQKQYEQQWDEGSTVRYYYKRKNNIYVNCYDTKEPYIRQYWINEIITSAERVTDLTQENFENERDKYYYQRLNGEYVPCTTEPWERAYYKVDIKTTYDLLDPQPTESDYNNNRNTYYYYKTNDPDKTTPISCNNIPYVKVFYTQNKNLFLPEVKQRIKDEELYYLHPTNLFIKGLPIYGVQGSLNNNIIWTQPILIVQNAYPVAMINQWDGKEMKIEDGTILSNRIGVGRKGNNNTFSGVLLGDWEGYAQQGTDLNQYTGIFGFANGIRTYSFLDDGTALIGKNTGGQLKFDGNESTITSASYNDVDGPGIKIDFDDATISMRGGSNNDNLFTIDASDNTSYSSKALYIGPSSNSNGSYFQVNWDGSATMSGAYITGDTIIQGIFDLGCQVNYGGQTKTLNQVLADIDSAAAKANTAATNALSALKNSSASITAINSFIGHTQGGTIKDGVFQETNVATFSYSTDKVPGVKVGTGAVALAGSGTWKNPGVQMYLNSSGIHFDGMFFVNSDIYKSTKPGDEEALKGRLIFVKE